MDKVLDDIATGLTLAGIALICAGVKVFQLSKVEREKEPVKSDGV